MSTASQAQLLVTFCSSYKFLRSDIHSMICNFNSRKMLLKKHKISKPPQDIYYYGCWSLFQIRIMSARSRKLRVQKVAVHLGYGTYIWLSVSKLPLKCIVSLCSVVKQRLKCNTGKVCNCLIQFLLTMVRGYHFQHLL
jgi:hypothetical protein